MFMIPHVSLSLQSAVTSLRTTAVVNGQSPPLRSSIQRPVDSESGGVRGKKEEEEEERQRLASELQEIERERSVSTYV